MAHRVSTVYGLCSIVVGLISVTQVRAAPSTSVAVDATNTIPNVVANTITADGDGQDWTGSALLIDLTAGSIYNAPDLDSDFEQMPLWALIPGLQWDSAVGIPGDNTDDLACGGCFPPNLEGTGPGAADITWANSRVTDTGPVQIANISMTNDAQGTWQLLTGFAGGVQVLTSGPVINGAMVPEPAAAFIFACTSFSFLNRRRRQ